MHLYNPNKQTNKLNDTLLFIKFIKYAQWVNVLSFIFHQHIQCAPFF